MSEHIVDFGDTSSAFVGLAMAEARAHGAELREEIVRCWDCKHCYEERYGEWGRVWFCEKFGDVKPDGFCAWGERRN